MLTAERLAQLSASDDHHETAKALREYVDSLEANERNNLLALVDMNDAAKLDAMAKEAAGKNQAAAVFVGVAATMRRAKDAIAKLAAMKGKLDALEAAGATELPPGSHIIDTEAKTPYELPVISFAGKPEYAILAVMQKGVPLKLTKVNGWGVLGSKPSDQKYTTPELVADLLARHVVVPAPGQSWENPTECFLSAIGWRGMGCCYTDRSSQIESRVYELCGSPHDNPTARRWRSILAEWRARQAKRDTLAGWNRYAEFPITIPDKVTGDGVKTITVLFECGRVGAASQNAPDHFEFFGEVNAQGYHQHIQGVGATTGKSVNQHAYDIAAKMCAEYAAERKAAAKPPKAAKAKPVKPAAPPLTVLDDNDDADAMARELGLL